MTSLLFSFRLPFRIHRQPQRIIGQAPGAVKAGFVIDASGGYVIAKAAGLPGEYSYPAIIPTQVGMAVTCTWRRERIAFWLGSIERIAPQ